MGKSIWDERREAIQRMVAQEMTDAQIGVVFGVTWSAVYQARHRLKIRRPKVKRQPTFGVEPTPPLVGVKEFDPDGQEFTRYPARYAEGAFVQGVTARPRR